MRRAIAIVLCACGAAPADHAIGNATSGPPAIPAASTLSLSEVCGRADGTVSASWPAPQHRGQLFELVDRDGFVATARIGRREIDCDDCPGPSVEAAFVGRGPARLGCFAAFGPVTAPLIHATMRWISSTTAISNQTKVTGWQVTGELDLDGDRHADVAIVHRCAQVTASGCSSFVCNRVCEGLRPAADSTAPVTAVQCSGFVPDVADCKP